MRLSQCFLRNIGTVTVSEQQNARSTRYVYNFITARWPISKMFLECENVAELAYKEDSNCGFTMANCKFAKRHIRFLIVDRLI